MGRERKVVIKRLQGLDWSVFALKLYTVNVRYCAVYLFNSVRKSDFSGFLLNTFKFKFIKILK